MKLTKRMQNALVQGLVLNTLVFIVFLGIFLFMLYPNIQAFDEKKTLLADNITSLEQIKTSGLSFEDFRQSIGELGLLKDPYYENILKQTNTSFYNKYFQNKTEADYVGFLSALEKDIVSKKNDPEYIKKNEIINTVLPLYTGNKNSTEDSINDLYFINYIENILYNFNLTSIGDIGFGKMEKLSGVLSQSGKKDIEIPVSEAIETKKNTLQEDIYFIPLTFDIKGAKGDILDFLHFFENVGSILSEKDSLGVYKDTVLTNRLDGSTSNIRSNIYENQIATIYSLSLPEYLDSSTFGNQSTYKSLVDTVRRDQSRQEYILTITLHFYVSGLPVYKIEQTITSIKENIESFTKKAQQDQIKLSSGQQDDIREKLRFISSIIAVVSSLDDEVTLLQTSLTTENSSTNVYESLGRIETQFGNIQDLYSKKIFFQ